ncbi:NAD-dependent succinate-semialdehyde dehydrogenase [Sphingomonas sp. CL5.1]|uniref:NAD-dependent succinate-semialdehyde dehydrogenase n=1 Tax=Sphingomonas sp. CL5.1 TaxID=2653203 RepID=UPI0020C627A5|nr:NAD-dependent succinate-semialdehyde dehydrogenase [Sphingomonas sp. CL5.1]
MSVIYPDTQLLINGSWRDGAMKRRSAVYDPATASVIGHYAMAEPADLEEAIQSAGTAFAPWRDAGAYARSGILRRAGVLLRERADQLAELITTEMGKPLIEARAEVMSSADLLDWFAGEGRRAYGQVIPARTPNVTQMVLKQPVGPVAAFTPWNFPMSQLVRKLGPALSVGCTVIAKPPEDTPASPAALARALLDAGLPAGVLNIVFGEPAQIADYLIPHPVIRKVSFTGSVPVGKQLAALAGKHMKRITMELGGHNPVIVCDDANVETAAAAVAGFKVRNAGQVCISPTRVLVQKGIYERFAAALAEHVGKVRVGSGLKPGTSMGPLVSERRLKAVSGMIEEAIQEGAHILASGEATPQPGFFHAPTILTGVSLSSRIQNDEPFGPVAILSPFDTIDEAITEANRLPYGLAAYAFTSSIRNSQRLQTELEVGMLAINHTLLGLPELPLGGVKDSGFGSEGGSEAIDSYLISKLVTQAAI